MGLRIGAWRFCWTEKWQQLFLDFSYRFVIGRDCFYPTPTDEERPPLVGQDFGSTPTRVFLARFPAPVARKIAYENAVKLFHLNDAARQEAERENLIALRANLAKPQGKPSPSARPNGQ